MALMRTREAFRETREAEDNFISSYLRCLNVRQAAADAGMSERAGEVMAKRPHVIEAVDRILAKQGMTPAEVLTRLARIASNSIGDFLDIDSAGGARINLDKARERGQLAMIKEVKFSDSGSVESIKLHSSMDALKEMASILGMKETKISVSVENSAEVMATRQAMAAMLADPERMREAIELRKRLSGGVVVVAESRGADNP